MATEFIPFAQMSVKEKREHLEKAHGTFHTHGSINALHKEDHRLHDGTDAMTIPHAHTKVARRTKR
jgi:hypothetical protein